MCSTILEMTLFYVTQILVNTHCHPLKLCFLIRAALAYIAQTVIPLVRPTLHKDLAALCLTDN